MKSVADDLRAKIREKTMQLSLDERFDLAFQMGREEIEFFRQANGLDWETAKRILERRRQESRRTPSKCMLGIIEGSGGSDDDPSHR
jgi:hypothetical protein